MMRRARTVAEQARTSTSQNDPGTDCLVSNLSLQNHYDADALGFATTAVQSLQAACMSTTNATDSGLSFVSSCHERGFCDPRVSLPSCIGIEAPTTTELIHPVDASTFLYTASRINSALAELEVEVDLFKVSIL